MKSRTSLATKLAAAALLAGLILALLPAIGRADSASTVIVLMDTPYPCKILKHDEKTLTVFLLDTQTPTSIPWDSLTPSERARLRKLLALSDAQASDKPMGKQIDGVEVTMNNNMTYRGLELADRQTEALRFFIFPGVPRMGLARKDIKSVQPCKLYEGEIYSPRERLRMEEMRNPSQTAEDEFRRAKWCKENELPQEAYDHFAKCKLLDPTFEERCKEEELALAQLAKKLQAGQIYQELLAHLSQGRYGLALKIMDLLEKEYPDFVENPKLAMQKPEIQKKHEKSLRRQVVSLWYMYMDNLVQKCANSRMSETPAIPGKAVYLVFGGEPLQGTLTSAEDAAVVVLNVGGREVQIKREFISKIENRMVEKGPWRERTLAECRKYVEDTKGGISTDILKAVTAQLGIGDKEALAIWEKRLSDPIVVDSGGIKEPELVVAFHDAHWGAGSWLRGGGPGAGAAAVPGRPGGARPGVGGVGGANQPGGGNPRGAGGPGGAQPQWKDEETWWKEQPTEVKAGILHAMCAEKIMRVEKTYEEACVGCGGTGQVERMSIVGGSGRTVEPCPVCRGSGKFWGILYR